jgi:opacity protein-like surface antigen
MRVTRAVLLVVAASALAAPAFAQAPAPRTEPGTGYRAYVVFDRVSFAAEQSFDAVLGKTSLDAIGAGGEFRFWKGLFARGGFSTMEETGTRAFIVSGQPVSVGVPLTVEVRPIEIAAGWRIPLDRGRRFVAYGGGGLLFVKYRETSDFAEPGDNVDDSFNGYLAFGGIDVRIWRLLSTGVEVQFRSVPDALGREDSISAAFDETDLGGTAIRFLVGIRK